MTKPRVLLADDHTLVLDGFHKLLEEHCEIVGRAEDGRRLVEAAQRLDPDVVIADISMPRLNGIDAARQLRKVAPKAKLIFVTMHADPAYVSAAFKAGASGYLLKRSAGSELIHAVQTVMQDHYYVTPLIAKGMVEAAVGAAPLPIVERGTLTPRQREVLQLAAEGRTVKEIAGALNISPKTVEFHKTQIMEHLDLHTTADLTKYAISHGLISPE
jgi:DNA-binding NarL/FixJ family response regulator